MKPESQTVPPVQPWPPHWPQCATVPAPLPPAGGVEPVPVEEVVGEPGAEPPPPSAALSLFLTNVSAAEPYSFA